MDEDLAFTIGILVGVCLVMLPMLFTLPSRAEVTCSYVEEQGYTIAVYEDTCMIEVDGAFIPVEDILEK